MSFAVQRIDHVVLRVRDLNRMIRFYERALGCAVERRLRRLRLVQLRAGDSLIDLIATSKPAPRNPNMDHLCFRIEPFEPAAIAARLRRYRIEVGEVVQRYGAEGTGPSLYFTDPEGNQIELKGPAVKPPRRSKGRRPVLKRR